MSTTTETTQFERIGAVIRAATGETYGDGMIVSDVLSGYADSRYGSADAIVVLGNWNDRRWQRPGEPALTREERLPSRLFNALEWLGAECEWSDEWSQCAECYRAIRTEPDCYSFTLGAVWVDDEGYVCEECALADPEYYLVDYVNAPDRALTWLGRTELERLGYVQWEASDPHQYETGWYPGQTDDPANVLLSIQEQFPWSETVFLIDSVGQFDCRWSAYVKGTDSEDSEDAEDSNV